VSVRRLTVCFEERTSFRSSKLLVLHSAQFCSFDALVVLIRMADSVGVKILLVCLAIRGVAVKALSG
jgi:hypothetical protein